jgi:hypothetical protein
MALTGLANPQVVIVGAGPYGLSIAAYLRRLHIAFRICGVPMQNWRNAMPMGMFLKSEGGGSNLSDPSGAFTLRVIAPKGVCLTRIRLCLFHLILSLTMASPFSKR